MKLLHTSDWHLGATLGGLGRDADHIAALDEIVEIAQDQKPHLILHTGDVFDTARPTVDIMRLALDALRRLSAIAPVVVTAGNHDSPPLFNLFNQVIEAAASAPRIRFVTNDLPVEPRLFHFPASHDETIRLACTPFVHRKIQRDLIDANHAANTAYAEVIAQRHRALRNAFAAGHERGGHVDVYAAHLHTRTAELAKSERAVHVTDDYAIDTATLPPVAYAAFGHIHKPQALSGEVAGRYAGSPIQLEYGEEGEKKSVVIVEAKPGTTARLDLIELQRARPLVRLEGSLDELAAKASKYSEPMILAATVESDTRRADLVEKVSGLFPNAQLHHVYNRVDRQEQRAVRAGRDVDTLDLRDLFREFLGQRQGMDRGQSERLFSLFEGLLQSAETGSEPELDETSAVTSGTME